jgi:hypothetical protein
MDEGRSLITIEQATGSVLKEIEDAFFDIPFENSDFQNRAFVVAGQITPARAYRAIGLRMFAKIHAVKEHKFRQDINAIDIEEKEGKLADPSASEFDRRRLRIEILKLEDGAAWGAKLLNDALRELNCLYSEFKQMPKYTREQFEAEEAAHFTARLTRQLKHNGAQESLANMREDLPSMDLRIANALSEMKRLGLLEE